MESLKYSSFGQEYTYGKSETTTRDISREYPIIVPAYHKVEISLSLFQYNMDVEYVARCRGLTSGKLINIKGRWTGVDVVESDAVLNVNPLQGGTGVHRKTQFTASSIQTDFRMVLRYRKAGELSG